MANVFDAQIRAVDAASGPIRAMVQGMRGLIQAARGVSRTSAEGAKAAGAAGKASGAVIQHAAAQAEAAHLHYIRSMSAHVKLLNGHFGSLNTSITAVSGSFAKFLPALGAVTAGASLVGLFGLVKSTADATIQTGALTAKLGITAKELGGLSWAAKSSGVETDVMVGSLEKLNKTLGMAAAGKGKDAAALFAHLGMKMEGTADHTRSVADLMPELADAFSKTRDPAMRALMATTLFGKEGMELLPVLMKGRIALEESAAAAAKFGYVATADQKQGLIDFAHNWEELEAAIAGFKRQIASTLAPILAPVIALARDWVVVNKAWIATAITDKVVLLAAAISHINFREIIAQTTLWAHWTYDLIQSHGGLRTVLGALALIMGSPMLSAVAGVIGVFLSLGRVIVGLGSLIWANPILAAIGLVVGGAYLLYRNWDWVKEQVGAIFVWFSHQGVWAQVLRDSIMPFIFLPMAIYENWEPIKAFFNTVWDAITDRFTAGWAAIKPIIEAMKNGLDWVRNSSFGRFAAGVVNAGTVPETADTGSASPGGGGPAPDLYRPGGPALAAAQNQGQVNVRIQLDGAPPGTKIESSASGIAQPPDTDVGYINPLAYAF